MTKVINKIKDKQAGVVLLVSLVILTLLIFAAVTVAGLLLGEIRSARYLDNAVIAHYVAESGVEKALFLLKEAKGLDEGASQSLLFSTRVNKMYNLATTSNGITETGDPDRYYHFDTLSETFSSITAQNFDVTDTVQFDIYNPRFEQAGSVNTDIYQLNIDWSLENCNEGGGALNGGSLLQVSAVEVKSGAGLLQSAVPIKQFYQCNCSGLGGTPNLCDQALFTAIAPTKFYHMSVRSLDQKVASLTITAQNNDPTQVDIPSVMNITSTGVYRDAQQTITVQTPWDVAVADVFDYVIFSESSLIKNVVSPDLQPFDSLCGICTGDGSTGCSNDGDCSIATGTCNEAVIMFCPLDGAPETNTNPIIQTNEGQCNATCTGLTYCGDGTPQTQNGVGTGGPDNDGIEQCDDGDSDNLNGCDNTCQDTNICGDDTIRSPNSQGLLEACDDGNTTPGDGCDAACQVEGGGGGSAVSILDSWTGSSGPAPLTPSFTASAGTNRLLLVAVWNEDNNAANSVDGVTFGSPPVIVTKVDPVNGEAIAGTGWSNGTWLGYILDVNIPGGSQSIAVSWSDGDPSGTNQPNMAVAVATLENVFQAGPIGEVDKDSRISSNFTSASLSQVDDGDMVVVTSFFGDPADPGEYPPGFLNYTVGYGFEGAPFSMNVIVGTRAITTTGSESPTIFWSAFINKRTGMVAAEINAAP